MSTRDNVRMTIVAGRTPTSKVISCILALGMTVAGGYVAHHGSNSGNAIAVIIGILVALGFVYESIAQFRFRLVVTETEVQLGTIRIARLRFGELTRVRMSEGSLYLFGDNRQIKITGRDEHRDQVIAAIAAKVEQVPGVHFEGDESDILKYFSKKPGRP